VTFHISGLDRASSGGFALLRAVQQFVRTRFGAVSFIGPGEEDAELARLEQVARDALTGRMAGL
jgi:ABC-type transporter Mla MlaB component